MYLQTCSFLLVSMFSSDEVTNLFMIGYDHMLRA